MTKNDIVDELEKVKSENEDRKWLKTSRNMALTWRFKPVFGPESSADQP